MSANVASDGNISQLDRRPEPDENITESAVKDPARLSRYLLRLFREVALLKRRWAPRRLDFRGIVSTGTAMSPQTVYLDHNFGGAVVWWVVKATDLGAGSLKLAEESSTSTDNRLVLSLMLAGTFTIRVEEAG